MYRALPTYLPFWSSVEVYKVVGAVQLRCDMHAKKSRKGERMDC